MMNASVGSNGRQKSSGRVARCLLILFFITTGLLTARPGQAQALTISGTVADSTKKAAAEGVTVREKATGKSTLTDAAGHFKIAVQNRQAILVFTAVGFATREVRVGDKTILNVSLQAVASDLDDVIVVGYGTTTRRNNLGTVGKANVEDMQKAPVSSFDQALAGRIAGVVVTSNDGQPGAASNIVIRGSSLTQDASPLYVIDGFPMENIDINSINPADIESLEVLKDASSIAIYGSRGANGVVMITTRRGKSGPPRITFNYSIGFQQNVRRIKMMNPYEFVRLQLELDSIARTIIGPSYNNALSRTYLDPAKNIGLDYYRNVEGYDWQDRVLQTGIIQNGNLSLTGGNQDTRYALSLSYFNQKGLIVNTGLKRYDGRFTLDQRINKNIRAGLTISYASSNSFGTTPSGGGGVVQSMWQYRPVNNISSGSDLQAVLIDSASQDFNSGTSLGDNLINPYIQATNEYRSNQNATGTINGFVEITFLKKFRLKMLGGYNATYARANGFYNSQTQQGNLFKNNNGTIFNTNGINANLNNTVNQNYTSENTVSYQGRIRNIHVFDALAGFTYNYANASSTGFRVINIPQAAEYLVINSIGSGGTPASSTAFGSHWQLYSFLGRLQYTYNRRYSILLTGRTDGSSKFAPGNQWGYFSAVSGGWTFTEEKFMAKLKRVIDFGKLKVSYGTVGNNKVGDFSYLAQLSALTPAYGYVWGNNSSGNTYTGGIVPYNYGNNQLTWETTREFDLGASFSILKERITIDMDYYSRKTNNFLLAVSLPLFAGYANSQFGASNTNAQYRNIGSILNRGFELTISSLNIKGRKFSWNTSFNIGFNRSKVLNLYDGKEMIATMWGINGIANNSEAWITKVGGPVSAFYGYEWAGLYQYGDFNKLPNGTYALKPGIPTYTQFVQPGDPKYVDLNGDGVVDANDRTTLGSPLPVFTGGLTNNFTYKNFSLSVFMQYSYGNKVLNANKLAFMNTGSYYLNGNQFAAYENRWTPDNTNTDIPRARITAGSGVVSAFKGDAAQTFARPSSWLIEDGSFIRLKTVAIGYNLPPALLKRIKVSGINVYASAQNLLTLTRYTGIDPEVSTFRQSNPSNAPSGAVGGNVASGTGYSYIGQGSTYGVLTGGYDFTPYPRAISVVLGCRVNF